jgi:hypothetical protein
MSQVKCNCRDCGKEMSVLTQPNSPRVGGSMDYVTCLNSNCLLYTVTREHNTYLVMTHEQLEEYREMNRRNQTNA